MYKCYVCIYLYVAHNVNSQTDFVRIFLHCTVGNGTQTSSVMKDTTLSSCYASKAVTIRVTRTDIQHAKSLR